MKKILSILFFAGMPALTWAQLTVQNQQTAIDLVNTLVASSGTAGITISNPVLTCDTLSNGLFSGTSNLGISNGIVLGTGAVATDTSLGLFGIDGGYLDFSSYMANTAGDADLNTLVTSPTYDACVLEFDLQPAGNYIEFEYVFGSEEYPDYNCTSFNDIFAFFVSGPGITGLHNMAIIPGTTIPVSINSINDGSNGNCSSYQNLYVSNTGSITTVDGFTTPLIATHPVTPGQTYHLKLAVSDVSDGIFNTFVFLKANSLKSGTTGPNAVSSIDAENSLQVYPSVVDDQLQIQNNSQEPVQLSLLDINGKQVFKQKLAAYPVHQTIPMSALTQGMYFVQMRQLQSGRVSSSRIFKQ
ncbi:MAG: T9SS type A sorting domain-containing protein [Chitinophagaceae bacterium]|jgi:hypothetical protein|nr:T9SS type A sorting domain-containing protein [Chitinophagaceae bacterium]